MDAALVYVDESHQGIQGVNYLFVFGSGVPTKTARVAKRASYIEIRLSDRMSRIVHAFFERRPSTTSVSLASALAAPLAASHWEDYAPYNAR